MNAMTSPIEQFIAAGGKVTVLPPGVARGGGSPGLMVPDPHETGAAHHTPGEGFNNTPLSMPMTGLEKARSYGMHNMIAVNQERAKRFAARRAAIVAAYDADPTPETIHRIAGEHNLSPSAVARVCREAGRENVIVSLNGITKGRPKGKALTANTSAKMGKIMALLIGAAEKGIACPSNAFLSIATDMSDNAVAGTIAMLEKTGHITVERFTNSRVVTIAASGASTKRPKTEKIHPRAKGVK